MQIIIRTKETSYYSYYSDDDVYIYYYTFRNVIFESVRFKIFSKDDP